MFCTQPPPPTKHHPLPSTSDPRTTTPSSKRKRVTIDVEAAAEDRQRLYYTKEEDIRLMRDTYASGRCDQQLMQQALDLYHNRNGHQFTYVHWWEAVKDSQKWKIHIYTEGDGTKRSAPTPTENAQRPPGTKRAKKATGKEKEAPSEMNDMKEQIEAFLQAQADTKVQTNEMMELQSRLYAQKVEANRLAYEAAKERTVAKLAEERTKLFDKFTQMLSANTTTMEPWAKEMHVRAVTR
ncbi:hypothetical protein ZWY2020_012239 [Hordeum vulgare]|nr:hypothetical protein ZWY2020_012239 [Hordeum vulgare]